MKFTRRRDDEEQGIDISPLIDMVFILLIFFMVSTTFVKDQSLRSRSPRRDERSPRQYQGIADLYRQQCAYLPRRKPRQNLDVTESST